MTKPLTEMTVTEAASTALELLLYSEYVDAQEGNSWSAPYTGTFEEYLNEHEVRESFRSDYGNDEPFELDTQNVWEHLKYEASEGTRDGWTAKVEASHGGEGEGDQYWMVVSVSDGTTTRFFRKDGWYASYDGGYLDGETSEVHPKEKTVVYYE